MKRLIPLALLLQLQLGAAAADGVALYNQKQYAKAAAALGQQITQCKSAAQLPTLYYYLGCSYYGLGQFPQAERTFRYIRNTYPTTNEARLAGSMLSTIASATAQAARAVADAALAANARSSHSLFSSSGSGSGSGATAPSAARPGAIASRVPVGSDSPSSDSAPTEHTPTSARISPHADEAELAKLPDGAKFYFKRGDHGHMEVTLRINNRPVPCWFDTGAAAYFGMDQLRSAGIDVSKAVPAGYARGWAGNPVPIWRMPAQVTLGNLTRTLDIDMQQGGGDSHIAALIGQDFVQGYQYEIDDKGGVVNLHKTFKTAAGQTEQKVDSLYDVPCTFSRGDDVIKMEINGRTCDAFIDTGASNTIIDARTARAAHIEITDDMERATMSGVGGNFSVVVAYVNLRVGPIRREGFRVLVGGTAGTCIGQDFMSGWRFKVDRQKGMMRFFH